jgi:hypothetical protein
MASCVPAEVVNCADRQCLLALVTIRCPCNLNTCSHSVIHTTLVASPLRNSVQHSAKEVCSEACGRARGCGTCNYDVMHVVCAAVSTECPLMELRKVLVGWCAVAG